MNMNPRLQSGWADRVHPENHFLPLRLPRPLRFCSCEFAAMPTAQLHFLVAMYEDFVAVDRWNRQPIHCLYQALIVAIATRHADAIDIKFLAGGRPVWIALPHPAWVEYQNRTGQIITDPLAVQVAGHFLKSAIESGEDGGREMYSLTVTETLEHLDAVLDEVNAAKPRA